MKDYRFIIGIDPDVSKSGICLIDKQKKTVSAWSATFPEFINYLNELNKESMKDDILFVVEAGWLNVISSFHNAYGKCAQRIAKNVGSNHETGKKIIEMINSYEFNYLEQRPLKKIWKKGKISQEELYLQIKNVDYNYIGNRRMNQDVRDACLIALMNV